MEIPKATMLWSSDGHHAGFMLLVANEKNDGGSCVFMLSPVSCEGIESEMGIIVSELKETGEHGFSVAASGSNRKITVFTAGFPDVVFEVDSEFSGDAFTEFGGVLKCVGSVGPIRGNA